VAALHQIAAEAQCQEPISSVRFSADGKWMAVALEGRIHLLDAFNGAVLHTFATGARGYGGPAMEPTFSPDSRYLLSGGAQIMHLPPKRLIVQINIEVLSCSRSPFE